MLPTFPRITEFRARLNLKQIEALSRAMSPLLGQIERHVQFEGGSGKMLRHDSSIDNIEMKAVSAEITLKRIPLSEYTEAALQQKLEEVAEQFTRGFSEHFYSKMDEVTSANGNVVDAGGKPLDEELILQAIEKMDASFAPDGSWTPPTLVAGSKFLQSLADLGGPSDAFTRRLEEIIDRKRNDFRRREADRILVG